MLSALFLSITAMAQTDVTTGVMRGKDYGVTYMLPKTEIEIVLQATKHTYTPGEFCRYADRYLRLNNVSAEPEEFWTLDKIETRIAGVPDKERQDRSTPYGAYRRRNCPLHQHSVQR